MKGITLVLLVGLLSSCVTIDAPIEVRFSHVERVEALKSQEGDDLEVTITLGELREALNVAEAYDVLIPLHNGEIDIANDIIDAYNTKVLYQQGHWRRLAVVATVSASIGFGIATFLLWPR